MSFDTSSIPPFAHSESIHGHSIPAVVAETPNQLVASSAMPAEPLTNDSAIQNGNQSGVQRMDYWTGDDPHLHYVIWTPPVSQTAMSHSPEMLPVVVFIHGAEHNAWCWEPVATLLAERYSLTSVAVDLRGHGESSWSRPARDASIEDFGEDVAHVVDQASSQIRQLQGTRAAGEAVDIVLIGHSMGGFIADHYARRHRLAGVYILDSVTPMQVMPAVRGWVLRSLNPLHPHRAWTCIHAMGSGGRMFGTRSLVRAWLLGPNATKDQVDQLFFHLLKVRESHLAFREVQTTGKADRRALRKNPRYLAEVWQTSHRRFASGARDRMMAPKATAASAQLTGATFVELPGLPHDAMLATNHTTEQVGEVVGVDIAYFVLGVYLKRYAVLKNPLPAAFSADDPLQERLANGTTRCCVVEIGPALSPAVNAKSQSFGSSPWVSVWFDEPDANGAVEELLPIECLDFLDEWATSVPGAARMHVTGQMPDLPPQLPLDERRSMVSGSERLSSIGSEQEAE